MSYSVFPSSWKQLAWSLLFISIGVTLFVVNPGSQYRTMKMTLQEDGETLTLWLKPNVDSDIKLHVFNITNKKAFLSGKEKLRVQEVGPYVYKLRFDYEKLSFNQDEGTVTVKPNYILEFVPSMSNGSETDRLILPNVPMLLLASKAAEMPYAKPFVNGLLSAAGEPIIELTLEQFLYGYDDMMVKFSARLFPLWIEFDNVGYFKRTTYSEGDTLTVFTGEKDFSKAGLIANYNGAPTLPFWDAPCNRLAGASDGKKFGNDLKSNETIYVYHKSFCRALPLIPTGLNMISEQLIPTTLYTFPDDMFDNGKTNADNKCFCAKDRCLPSGLADVSACYLNFPASMSLPHYYQGHPSLIEKIDGLEPNKNRHETKIFINQMLGIATSATIRLQSNIEIYDVTGISSCERFVNMSLPLAWVESGYTRLETTLAVRMFLVLIVVPIVEKGLSVFCVVVGLYLICKIARTRKLHKPTQFSQHVAVKMVMEDFTRSRNKEALILPHLQTLIKRNGAEKDYP